MAQGADYEGESYTLGRLEQARRAQRGHCDGGQASTEPCAQGEQGEGRGQGGWRDTRRCHDGFAAAGEPQARGTVMPVLTVSKDMILAARDQIVKSARVPLTPAEAKYQFGPPLQEMQR